MAKTLTWLHLSDLHLCPQKTDWDARRVLDTLKKDFVRMQEDHGLRPDLIFFTGDVVYGQLPESPIQDQFMEAAILFEDIRMAFSPAIPQENLFIIPGNHDVNWDKVHDGPTVLLDEYRKKKDGIQHVEELLREGIGHDWEGIMDRLDDYRQFLGLDDFRHLLQDPARLCYAITREVAGIKVGIAGLNSAWSCCRDRGRGKIWLGGHWQIQTLHQKIEQADIKIALAHHPLSWFEERNYLQTEMDENFDFFLHGHEHHSWVNPVGSHTRIEGGACYDRSDGQNGYNFVRLNLEDDTGEVWLRSYVHDGKGGWVVREIPDKTTKGYWPLTNRIASSLGEADRPIELSEASDAPLDEAEAPSATGAETRGVFGRESDIKKLLTSLRRKPIVAVYGLQGIGKTALIREAARADEKFDSGVPSVIAQLGMTFADLYRRLAPTLGCRGDEVEPPMALLGTRNFSQLARSARNAKPCLLHLEQAQLLFGDRGFIDPEIGDFLEAVARHVSVVRVVLECREAPPDRLLPESIFESQRVNGLNSDSVRAYFRRPFRGKPGIGWELSGENSQVICARLGSKGKKGLAHPLSLVLLAGVADGLGIGPAEALSRHSEELDEELERELFSDLYDKVLPDAERHILSMCALYRDYVPLLHGEIFGEAAEVPGAFDHLVRRCLLNSDEREERFYLHSMIAELTLRRGGDDAQRQENHAHIAEAWLKSTRSFGMTRLPNIIGASEAIYHFTKAGRFDRLSEFVNSVLARLPQQSLVAFLGDQSVKLKNDNRHEDNRHVLELLVTLDPNEPKHHRFLGETIGKLDGSGSEKALEHFQNAFNLRKDFPQHLASLGTCLLARSEAQKFIDLVDGMEEDVRSKAFNEYCRGIYARCKAKVGHPEAASRLRGEQIEAGSRDPAFYSDEARYLLDLGKASEALALLDRAVKLGIADDYTRTIRARAIRRLDA